MHMLLSYTYKLVTEGGGGQKFFKVCQRSLWMPPAAHCVESSGLKPKDVKILVAEHDYTTKNETFS